MARQSKKKSPRIKNSGGYAEWFSRNRWQSISVLLLTIGIVATVGAFHMGKTHASSQGYFWSGGKVWPTANVQDSNFTGYFKAGYHNINAVANCSGIIGGSVGFSGYYNYWWVHSPTIDGGGGWINQVHASGGGNNQNSFPWLSNWGKNSCLPV